MASNEVFTPIHDYLEAQWSATALVFENEAWPDYPSPTAWVLVEIYGDIYEQISIGAEDPADNLWREEGQMSLHVMIPDGVGTAQGRTYAKQLADLFRGMEIAGISFKRASIGAGMAGERDGNYFRMTTTVEFERDDP